MQRIRALWNRGLAGKVLISLVGLLVICCVFGVIARPRQGVAPSVQVKPTAIPTQVQSTKPPVATDEPTPVVMPVPTEIPEVAETTEARYVRIAQAGVITPIVRSGAPKGSWKAEVINLGTGAEVTLTMPVSVGLSNEQTVRQAKRHVAQVVKALFDGDAAITQVLVFGTVPDGSDGSELPVLFILLSRSTYAAWDGTADNLGAWRIAPRYK